MYVNQIQLEHEERKELTSSQKVNSLSLQLSSILGLEEMEAHVYLNLLRIGPISASALAKKIDVERTKTYRTIEKLLNQNIVSTTFSKPKLCVATLIIFKMYRLNIQLSIRTRQKLTMPFRQILLRW